MATEQEIDTATTDGFMLAITMASAKGLKADANEMMQFLADVAMGKVLARESVEEEFQKHIQMLGHEPTDVGRDDFFRVSRETRPNARIEDQAVAVRIMRELRASGLV